MLRTSFAHLTFFRFAAVLALLEVVVSSFLALNLFVLID